MLQQWIQVAEDRWLPLIKPLLEEVFTDIHLPSHDLQHHLRVWSNAARLLELLESLHLDLNYDLVEGILIACMFHDAGLVRETGLLHGQAGREMCDEFFMEGGFRKPERYQEILKAIEHHDAKTGNSYKVFRSGKIPGILSILTVADDLEALGIIGIYRYAEIYLRRGTGLELLGTRILENAYMRRDNLLQCCRFLPGIYKDISSEAEVLSDFWSRYNQQLQVVDDPLSCRWGELGIIQRIGDPGLEESGTGHTLISFFNELQKKLLEAGS